MKLYDDFIMPALGTVFEIYLYLDSMIFLLYRISRAKGLFRTVRDSTVETIKAFSKLHCRFLHDPGQIDIGRCKTVKTIQAQKRNT